MLFQNLLQMKNNSHPQKAKPTFKEVVEATAEVQNCYQVGLSALGKYSSKIELGDTKQCSGSVDIDACVARQYPQSNRWDYALCYKTEVFFVEVHTASTSEVSTVIKKLEWLKQWLHHSASNINALKANEPFYWIQSNGYHILPGSSQERLARQKGIRPISKLVLK